MIEGAVLTGWNVETLTVVFVIGPPIRVLLFASMKQSNLGGITARVRAANSSRTAWAAAKVSGFLCAKNSGIFPGTDGRWVLLLMS